MLIRKNIPTNIAKNYRPITCLPTYYKLMTLVFTNLVYNHVTTTEILALEQKGIRHNARGCKDQLLLDKTINEDARKRRKNLSGMWINYKKTYSSVAHSWLITVLKVYNINTSIIKYITQTMEKWRTKVFLSHKNSCIKLADITFLREIFQGDTLSPLMFCLALAPIRNILTRDIVRYKIMNTKVSNLLYIDDLKVYGKHDVDMERCCALIKNSMMTLPYHLGFKSAVMHMKRGKLVDSLEVQGITILQEKESYKYLRIIDNDFILHRNTKKITNK